MEGRTDGRIKEEVVSFKDLKSIIQSLCAALHEEKWKVLFRILAKLYSCQLNKYFLKRILIKI